MFLLLFVYVLSPLLGAVVDTSDSFLGVDTLWLRIGTAGCAGIVVVCALCHAALHEPSTHYVGWVAFFYALSPLYAVWNLSLVATSFHAIATSSVGDWYVTKRARDVLMPSPSGKALQVLV